MILVQFSLFWSISSSRSAQIALDASLKRQVDAPANKPNNSQHRECKPHPIRYPKDILRYAAKKHSKIALLAAP